jgi:SHS2 domain-containing protein
LKSPGQGSDPRIIRTALDPSSGRFRDAPTKSEGLMTDRGEVPVPGVSGLDHTADVGLEILAPTLPELFRRAAIGAMWLVLERTPMKGAEGETRPVELVEGELPQLLRTWVRLLLRWQEEDGFVAVDSTVGLLPAPLCTGEDGQGHGLRGSVQGVLDRGPVVRVIKGVTLHDLRLERQGGGWYGRIVLDV